ncbi:hypothetical protein BS47DRAFT_1370081 [Hydnum rufescens UP504]|uniref:Uncharacterized protein n=1 Tax=Hydnum rufescens UP504 TaxID=1448309 RepID=A0A9P6DKV4_9AGAM|nr:hypothetical protein BS47DRAFT_1370081 [Hydnum rufescens UP504]
MRKMTIDCGRREFSGEAEVPRCAEENAQMQVEEHSQGDAEAPDVRKELKYCPQRMITMQKVLASWRRRTVNLQKRRTIDLRKRRTTSPWTGGIIGLWKRRTIDPQKRRTIGLSKRRIIDLRKRRTIDLQTRMLPVARD